MRITDCHTHLKSECDPSVLLKQMDANAVDYIILYSPSERWDLDITRDKLLLCKMLFDAAPNRITGFAFVVLPSHGTPRLATRSQGRYVATSEFLSFDSGSAQDRIAIVASRIHFGTHLLPQIKSEFAELGVFVK